VGPEAEKPVVREDCRRLSAQLKVAVRKIGASAEVPAEAPYLKGNRGTPYTKRIRNAYSNPPMEREALHRNCLFNQLVSMGALLMS
jgi:hypothetical protein